MRSALGGDRRFAGAIAGNRRPEIQRIVLNREFETLRHDADNREAVSVERNRLVNQTWVRIKLAREETFAEHNHASALGELVFSDREGPAQHRVHAEYGKE